MPFQATNDYTNIGDYFLRTVRKLDTTFKDIITPNHPLFKRWESGDVRGMKEEPPGRGPVREIYINTPDRGTELSEGQRIGARDIATHESNTEAQYHWVLRLDTLALDLYTVKNTPTKVGFISWADGKRIGINKAHRNKQVDYVWNGATVGGKHIFGLKDAMRFDPTADPSRGKVGGIGVADVDQWTNNSANFNSNALTYTTGAKTATFMTTGTNCLLRLYSDCGYYAGGDSDDEVYPDVIPCNQAYWQAVVMLIEHGMMFRDEKDSYKLGIESVVYRQGRIFEDRNVPNDPNDATYGVAFLINSKVVEPVYASGIRNMWERSVDHPVDTVASVDKMTQMTMTYRALNRLGVHYGVIPTVSAS